MSDRIVFPVIADLATGEGQLLTGREAGEAQAGKGIQAFVFKDAAGNLIVPTLVDGKVPVTSEGAGVPKSHRAEDADGSSVLVDLATIALTPGKTYKDVKFTVSCRRSALFQIVQIDDASTTVHADVVLDAGQYSFGDNLGSTEIVAGLTGAQTLKIIAKNLDTGSAALSALRSTLSCLEMINA